MNLFVYYVAKLCLILVCRHFIFWSVLFQANSQNVYHVFIYLFRFDNISSSETRYTLPLTSTDSWNTDKKQNGIL